MSVIKHKNQRVGIFIDTQNLYHSAKNIYNSKVNYDGCLNLSAGVWLIHTSLTIERNSTIWIYPNTVPFSSFIAAYDTPSIGGNVLHSSSETYYYLYNNIPKFIVQMSPILFIVKNQESRIMNEIKSLRDTISKQNEASKSQFEQINKWKWTIIGGIVVITWLISKTNVDTLLHSLK